MPKLIVMARELRYAHRSMVAGDEFEASEKDARVLRAIGKAKDAVQTTPAPKRTARRPARSSAAISENGVPGEADPQQSELGGALYSRRDMRAED